MSVKIGHASIDERGKANSGAAGDQTKKEVYTRTWYSKPWHTVFRPESATAAEKIAKAMEQACANNNIGYDQYQRTTLYTLAKAENWNISKVAKKCETDCSALVAVCCNAAGITVSKDMYTGNEKSILSKTGAFTVYTDSKYTGSSANLKRGDILLGKGHTAIVLSNGANIKIAEKKAATTTTTTKPKVVTAKDAAESKRASLAGTYVVTAAKALNVRDGAGKNAKILVTIPKGTKVRCYGYYTQNGETTWLYVQFTYEETTYTGFVSTRYLEKR